MGRPTQGAAAKGGGGGDDDNGSRGIDRNGDVKRQEGSFRRGGRSTVVKGWRETLQRKQKESGGITWGGGRWRGGGQRAPPHNLPIDRVQ